MHRLYHGYNLWNNMVMIPFLKCKGPFTRSYYFLLLNHVISRLDQSFILKKRSPKEVLKFALLYSLILVT